MAARKSSDNDPDLLTIKQAAKLLNVSAASLRRWTDAGQMPCYRVGAQRARRFRREDLVAFIGQAPKMRAPAATGRSAAPRSTPEELQPICGLSADYGEHLCAIYGRPAGRLRLSVPLLSEGLKAGDVCFLVAGAEAMEHLLGALHEAYPDTRKAIGDGQLVFPELAEDRELMLDRLEEHFLKATYPGGRRLRIVGDMHWAIEAGWDATELYEYELTYNNTLGHRFPVISLCQYDAERFSGKCILDALKSHEDTYRHPVGQFCL